MRSRFDRIRHALSFELLGLALIIPLGATVLGASAHEIGTIAVVCSLVATGWTYLYNLIFDRWMQRRFGHAQKTPGLRVAHALLFEAGLLIALAPYIAWQMGVSLWQALAMDMGFALFYVVYAFVFNWLYDLLFPVQAGSAQARG